MAAELTNGALKNTLGMAVSVIATEHFMSAGLSSPWSVAKFAISQDDKDQVWHYFNEAAGASALFSVITSYMMKSWYPIGSSALTLVYYWRLYRDALSRTPTTTGPTQVLQTPTNPAPTKVLKVGWQPLSNEDINRVKYVINSAANPIQIVAKP